MSILFGHPTGSPNSFQAALAHYEADRLEAFCIPWMPQEATLRILGLIPGASEMTKRLSRRRFVPLSDAPKIQGRLDEIRRLVIRAVGRGNETQSIDANKWLMRTMRRECRRVDVTAIHAYEDCSLWQFEAARRRDKACIYDMPIGYYAAWEAIWLAISERYVDWIPSDPFLGNARVPLSQKQKELELADLVLVPSSFVESTIRGYVSDKKIFRAPYGVDLEFWRSKRTARSSGPLRYIYAGHLSLRKGTPLLLDAWKKAALKDAELILVGAWQLADNKRSELPRGVRYIRPCSSAALRNHYTESDVFVFPSFFEGFALVVLEALSCGLPVIVSEASGAPDVLSQDCGRVIQAGDLDALVESFRWYNERRAELPVMSRAAVETAQRCTWGNYRDCVSSAVAQFT